MDIVIKELLAPRTSPYPFELSDFPFEGAVYKVMGKPGMLTANMMHVPAKVADLLPQLLKLYKAGSICLGNRCGDNANFIIAEFRKKRYSVRKILVSGWHSFSREETHAIQEQRSELFGFIGMTMFTTYHAFPLFYFPDIDLYIAVETTIRATGPQFIIGKTEADIVDFIVNRYLVKNIAITEDIVKGWNEIIPWHGGTQKRSKTRKMRSKSRLRKRRNLD